jgi:hypothetical protein
MAANKEVQIVYGNQMVKVDLPGRSKILRSPAPLPPLSDPVEAIRRSLYHPVDHDPISDLVGPGSKVTIAFDDPVIPQIPMKRPDFRELAITVLLEELEKLNVAPSDVRLICANALHRKFTNRELSTILGDKIALRFGPSRLFCHDAEDRENQVFLGETQRGLEIELNRAVIESDQLFYVNITSLPFHGGWKSIMVGLSTFRSIRHHHRPFRGASGKSVMDAKRSSFQKLLWEMGDVVEKELARENKRLFTIESVLNTAQPQEIIAVHGGHIPSVHEKILDRLYEQQVVEVPEQADVGVFGIPDQAYYSNLSKINPILVRNQALSYAFGLYHKRPLIRQGGIAIFAHPCLRQFHPLNHPSYIELYDRILPAIDDPYEIWDLYAEDFAHRPEYVHKYRYAYGFHGSHPLILWGQGAFAFNHLSRIFLAGAQDREAARRIGFEPFNKVEEAIAEAESTLGTDCSIVFAGMPPMYIPSVGKD